VGTSLSSLGRLRDARAFHERALAVHRELGRRWDEAVEWSYLGVALHRAGRFADARRAHERAIDIHVEVKNARGEAADHMHLGYVLHQLGDFDRAGAELDVATRAFRRLGERSLEGVAMSYAGALAVEARRPEDAGPLLQQALVVHREVGSPRHEAVTRIHLAEHHAALGERKTSRAEAKRALSIGPKEPTLEVEHHAWALALAGSVERAVATAHALDDEVTGRAIMLLGLAARVERGAEGPERGRAAAIEARGVERVPLGSRVRFALAALEQSLRARLPALRVAVDGSRFEGEGGRRIELGRRAPLVNVLRHLVERRLTAPGLASPVTELLAAGWPGERVLFAPGQIRVRNAVAQLRKLGLRTAIVNGGGGWLLDPAMRVETTL
jgi:tetratricopeptide (TPR) repeat protein